MAVPLKVCFVSRKWPPAMGGMETYATELSRAIEAHCDVDRIVLPGHPDGSVPRTRELMLFGLTAGLRILFSRSPPDVVHVADMASWPFALCARLRRPRTRRILSAHGTDVSYPARGGTKGRLYGAYLRLGARLARPDTVIANSQATARCAESHGFAPTCVVPLAAEGDVPARTHPRRTVLFSGRLVPRKGCGWFIREVLPKLREDISLEVAGTIWDPVEGAALDHPRVRYLGKLDQTSLWQAYADAMCVVVPNITLENGEFEGFGLVAVEAAAAGGVVLAARHAGLTDAVLDGRTGFLLPPGDATSWSAHIHDIAGWTAERRAAFLLGSRKTCARHFTWRRVACETVRHYRADRWA